MADFLVKLTVKNGRLEHKPEPRVNARDNVSWISADGPITIEFKEDNPFRGSGKFKAEKDIATAPGSIRDNVASPKRFLCTITVGDQVFENEAGVDTPGSGRMQ